MQTSGVGKHSSEATEMSQLKAWRTSPKWRQNEKEGEKEE